MSESNENQLTPVGSTALVALKRYRIYRANRRNYLCVCAARDAQHALKIARQNFVLGQGAQAIPERVMRQAEASEVIRNANGWN